MCSTFVNYSTVRAGCLVGWLIVLRQTHRKRPVGATAAKRPAFMQCIRTIGAAGIAQLSSHGSDNGVDRGHVARRTSQLLHDTTCDRSMGQILTPEQLVGVGFSGWMAGYEYSDISCWE